MASAVLISAGDGTLSSSTMMVMMTAITPSEKASRREGVRRSLDSSGMMFWEGYNAQADASDLLRKTVAWALSL